MGVTKGGRALKRSIDTMILDKKKQQEQRRRSMPEEPDEVEIEMELPRYEPINAAKSVFDEGLEKRFGGINTAPSVFDRSAVFRTKKET